MIIKGKLTEQQREAVVDLIDRRIEELEEGKKWNKAEGTKEGIKLCENGIKLLSGVKEVLENAD